MPRFGRRLAAALVMGLGAALAVRAGADGGGSGEAEQTREFTVAGRELGLEIRHAREAIGRLDALSAKYADAAGLDDSAPRRDALRAELARRADRIDEMHSRFDKLLSKYQWRRGALAMLDAVHGDASAISDRYLPIERRQDEFNRMARDFRREIRRRLDQDALAYAESRRRAARGRMVAALSAAAVALLAAALLLALRRRRRPAPETSSTRRFLRIEPSRTPARPRPDSPGAGGSWGPP